MKQVWKYKIKSDEITLKVPKGGVIRYVDEQYNEVCIWIEVDPDESVEENRYIEVYGTGHRIYEDMGISRSYLGTAKLNNGEFVFHVYEYTGV